MLSVDITYCRKPLSGAPLFTTGQHSGQLCIFDFAYLFIYLFNILDALPETTPRGGSLAG